MTGGTRRRRVDRLARRGQVDELCAVLGSARQSETRRAAALALRAFDEPDTVDALTIALGDDDEGVRDAAARSLASLRDPQAIPALADVAASWPQAQARDAALETLRSFRSPRAASALAASMTRVRATRDDDSRLLAVVESDPSGAAAVFVVEVLMATMLDEQVLVAQRAVELLPLFPGQAIGPLLAALGSSSEARVRRRAAGALGRIGLGPSAEGLMNALGDTSNEVRSAAACALGDLRDPAAVEPLRMALGDFSVSVRTEAQTALGKLGVTAEAAALVYDRAGGS